MSLRPTLGVDVVQQLTNVWPKESVTSQKRGFLTGSIVQYIEGLHVHDQFDRWNFASVQLFQWHPAKQLLE